MDNDSDSSTSSSELLEVVMDRRGTSSSSQRRVALSSQEDLSAVTAVGGAATATTSRSTIMDVIPRFTATGGAAMDPIQLDSDDDSSSKDSDTDLRGRLMRRTTTTAAAVSRTATTSTRTSMERTKTCHREQQHSNSCYNNKQSRRGDDDDSSDCTAVEVISTVATAAIAASSAIALLTHDSDEESDATVKNAMWLSVAAVALHQGRSTRNNSNENAARDDSSTTDSNDDESDGEGSSSSSNSDGSSTASSILRQLSAQMKKPIKKQKRPAAAKSKSSSTSAVNKTDLLSQEQARTKSSTRRPTASQEARMQQQQEREEARQRKERERQEALEFRQREKTKRETARLAKQAALEAAKVNKQQAVARAKQQQGKHAKDEIAVLLDTKLFRHEELAIVEELHEHGYAVTEYRSALGCPTVQWIRQDYLRGGADHAIQQLVARNKTGYVHMPILAVVFDSAGDFIRLLDRSDDEDDFSALEQWLKATEAGWRSVWGYPQSTRPRIVLFLLRVNQELARLMTDFRAKRNGVDCMPPSSEELQDAIAWLLIQFQVECVTCSDSKYLYLEINKITRMLSEQPYQYVVTDLDCIHKLKRTCTDDAPLIEQATDCWMRQLQQLPGMSFDKARRLTKHYPTARSLWLAYQSPNLTDDEKRLLVADLCGSSSRQVKLSDQLYRLMTTANPDELV